jgi:hypothetical protein
MKIKEVFFIFIISLFFMPVLGSDHECYSTLMVSISSPDAKSLDGFTIEIDGKTMDSTYSGVSVIDLTEFSTGSHSVKAYKDEGGYYFEGIRNINIPCINDSSKGQLRITVPIRIVQEPPNNGENEEEIHSRSSQCC